MITRHFASTLCLTLGLCAFGCSSSSADDNSPPVVDALDVPATATIGTSGNYEIVGTLSAHDTDGVIHQVVLEIPGYTAPAILVDQQTIAQKAFIVQIDGRSPKGPLTATAKVVDDQGASASKTITVTLQ
jgi:hypothetical protein